MFQLYTQPLRGRGREINLGVRGDEDASSRNDVFPGQLNPDFAKQNPPVGLNQIKDRFRVTPNQIKIGSGYPVSILNLIQGNPKPSGIKHVYARLV